MTREREAEIVIVQRRPLYFVQLAAFFFVAVNFGCHTNTFWSYKYDSTISIYCIYMVVMLIFMS